MAHFQHELIWSINFFLYPIQSARCCQKYLPEITLGSQSLLKNSSGFSVLQKKPKPFTSRSLAARTSMASGAHISHDLFTTAYSPSSLPLYTCLPLCSEHFNLPLLNSHAFFHSDLKFCNSLLSTWFDLPSSEFVPLSCLYLPNHLHCTLLALNLFVFVTSSDGQAACKAPGPRLWPSCPHSPVELSAMMLVVFIRTTQCDSPRHTWLLSTWMWTEQLRNWTLFPSIHEHLSWNSHRWLVATYWPTQLDPL